MTIFAVGDIQGCLAPLQRVLEKVSFDPKQDQLWSTGDIVNRGPDSLATMRFLKGLGPAFKMVLGNHDLHLLAAARQPDRLTPADTCGDVLKAPDAGELLEWLRHQPLMLNRNNYILVHAGIAPQWSRATARRRAAELEAVIQGPAADVFFANMYGNEPSGWHRNLEPEARWRMIANYFTRMRYSDAAGNLELRCKSGPEQTPEGYLPWFLHANRKTAHDNIIFGHWAALDGRDCGDNLFPLDTGCVWGKRIRLLNLKTKTYTHCEC